MNYSLKRFLSVPLVLLGVVAIVFVLTRSIPGDPARLIAGERAQAEQIEQIRREYGLDKPLPVQFLRYLQQLAKGNLGLSMRSYRPVAEDMKLYFPASAELAVAGMLCTILIGVPIGVISAVKVGSWGDHVARFAALIGASFPIFWLGLAMQLIFFRQLEWLPATGRLTFAIGAPPHVTGMYTVDALLAGQWLTFVDAVKHLILPAITLSLGSMAITSRITRSNMLDVLGQDYIRTARAKGMTDRVVHFTHALRNAMIPVLTILGLQAGALLGGTFLTETIFDWPGMGSYAVGAITTLDYQAIMSCSLMMALIYVCTNFVVDQIYALIDPRIRY